MSRLYSGRWAVRVVFAWGDEDVHDFTEPMTYEDAEHLCWAFSWGLPFVYGLESVRVKRALIVTAAAIS